jgi:HEAT repeat protein
MVDIVGKLILGLQSENTDVRFYSAKALRSASDERAFDALLTALEKEKNDEIRNEIGEALVTVADKLYRQGGAGPLPP